MKKDDYAILLLRLALGAVFIAHGLQKFFPGTFGGGDGIPGFAASLDGMGIPLAKVMAYIVAGWEVAGGLLVALGIFSRIAAFGIFGIMVVAFLKVHFHSGFFIKNSGFEYVLVLGAVALSIVMTGPGKIALERSVKPGH